MALLDWFRQSTPKIDANKVSSALVEETIDYVVKMTDARLSLVNHYRARLTGPVTRTLQYLGSLREHLPVAHDVGPLSWSLDPSIRAFFSQPADLVETFSNSEALHQFAASSSPLDPIFAILAMRLDEQQRFGVSMQGSMVMRDVAQTALNFSHHRLRLFANSEQDLVRSMNRRMLDELALIALEHMQAEQAERRELEEHRSLLAVRLSTFQQRGAGLDSFMAEAGSAVGHEESGALLRQLELNETRLAALGSPSETLDRQLDYLAEVLAEPMRFVQFESRKLHIDSMNVVTTEGDGDEISFAAVTVDRHPPFCRVFVPVRVDRALVGDGRKLRLDSAERWL